MDQQNDLQLYKDREFSEIISFGFKFIKSNFKIIFKSIAFYALPFYLLGTAFFGLFLMNYLKFIQSSTNIFRDISSANGPRDFALALIEGLFSTGVLYYLIPGIILFSLGYASFTFVIGKILDSHAKREDFNTEPYWPAFFKFVVKLFFIFLIYLFIMALIVGLFILIASSGNRGLLLMIAIFGGISFFILLIYLLPTISVLSQVLISEPELNVFDSLKRAFLLVKANWSKCFGTVLITYILVGVFGGIFSLIISSITGGVNNIIIEGPDIFTPMYVIAQVINQIISAFLNIIPLTIFGVLFFVLKELKDKISIQQNLDIWSSESINNPDIKEDY